MSKPQEQPIDSIPLTPKPERDIVIGPVDVHIQNSQDIPDFVIINTDKFKW